MLTSSLLSDWLVAWKKFVSNAPRCEHGSSKVDSVTVWLPLSNENRTKSPMPALMYRGLNRCSFDAPTWTSWTRGGMPGMSTSHTVVSVPVEMSACTSISSADVTPELNKIDSAMRVDFTEQARPEYIASGARRALCSGAFRARRIVIADSPPSVPQGRRGQDRWLWVLVSPEEGVRVDRRMYGGSRRCRAPAIVIYRTS